MHGKRAISTGVSLTRCSFPTCLVVTPSVLRRRYLNRRVAHSLFVPYHLPPRSPVSFEPLHVLRRPRSHRTGANGQACFWFSNGCAIGCDKCDGSTRGPIPAFAGSPLLPVPGHVDSGTQKPVSKEPICGAKQSLPATICDPKQRTVNTGAKCGSVDDFFYYSPWRRPGSAPVIDACGTAGGRIPGQGPGGYGAQYQNTTHAKVVRKGVGVNGGGGGKDRIMIIGPVEHHS